MVKIHDHSGVLQNTYFISEGSKVVLIDLENSTIKASDCRLWLYYLIAIRKCPRLDSGSMLYTKVLHKYNSLLGELVLPNKYQRGFLFEDLINTEAG